MENNKKFDALHLAEELWAEIESKSDVLKTDTAKRKHVNAFFKKRRLTTKQVEEVIANLTTQLKSEKTFDATPHVHELYDLWINRQFHYFFKDEHTTLGNFNMSNMDLSRYFHEKKIPFGLRNSILEGFVLYMRVKSSENRKKVLLPLMICYGSAVILAFFTPTIMHRLGVLSPDAGWGMKTINVVIGFIFFFLIARRVNSFWLDKVLLGK